MEIRTFVSKDRSGLIELWERCALVRPSNDPVLDVERKVGHSPEMLFVGIENDTVVGSVMVGYDGHRGWLNYLAVSPEWRRHGYATQLLRHAEEHLASRGCAKVNLQVRASNVDAVTFYERIGYSVDDVVSLGRRLEFDE